MAKNIVQGSLITTFRCNAKCNMCNIWKHQTRPEEEIDASYYEKLPAGLRINITGGECTIRKDIDKIFEILYPKSSLLELSTNGYNTETIVALANKYPNILIRVSVEGLPALNDKKRGTLNGFDHALRRPRSARWFAWSSLTATTRTSAAARIPMCSSIPRS